MKIISRFSHAIADYMTGLVLLLAPNLLGFANVGGAAVWVPRIVGIMILRQAMITDYELGVTKVLPIGAHLMTAYIVAIFLLTSPWLFGFSHRFQTASIVVAFVGIAVCGLTAMTQPRRV